MRGRIGDVGDIIWCWYFKGGDEIKSHFFAAFYYAKCVITIYTIIQCTNWCGSIISINQSQITAHNRDLYFNKTKVKPTKIIDFQSVSVFNSSVKLCIIGQHREDEDEVGIEQSFWGEIFLDFASEKLFFSYFLWISFLCKCWHLKLA